MCASGRRRAGGRRRSRRVGRLGRGARRRPLVVARAAAGAGRLAPARPRLHRRDHGRHPRHARLRDRELGARAGRHAGRDGGVRAAGRAARTARRRSMGRLSGAGRVLGRGRRVSARCAAAAARGRVAGAPGAGGGPGGGGRAACGRVPRGRGAGGGAAAVVAAVLLVGLAGEGRGVDTARVLGFGAGIAELGVLGVAAAWAVESSARRERLATRAIWPAVLVAAGLAALSRGGGTGRTFALWSGPWGWAVQPATGVGAGEWGPALAVLT